MMLAPLAHVVHRHRRLVIGIWIVLTAFGVFATKQVSSRWLQRFSIPGYSAYETNQKALRIFGTGEMAPVVVVFHTAGDITKQRGIQNAVDQAAKFNPGSRISSYFTTGSAAYVSHDRHTTFAEIYPRGNEGFNEKTHLDEMRATLTRLVPAGVAAHVTGRNALQEAANGGSNGPSVFTEAMIGGAGALVILLFVFGTLPAIAMPIAIAIASILNTFTLVWLLTYVMDVSIIVQFLIALVGLGVAIDYALLMIFRFREELAAGEDVETALTETMTHAGRSSGRSASAEC
jgi:RND superfamily putative drug exporter